MKPWFPRDYRCYILALAIRFDWADGK